MQDNSATLDPKDRSLLRAYRAVFCNPAGQRVLRHLENLSRATHSVTEDEIAGRPIDTTRFFIQQGMARMFWKIRAQVTAAELLLKGEKDD